MIVKIREMLEKKDKTMYYLSKQVGVSQNNLSNLADGKTSSVKFEILDKICSILECDIQDILEAEKIEKESD